MSQTQTQARLLAERLCRPQRIGVFGHRGVGKTTLVTMLYREAVGGRLPGLRLAAADARTANYLADKILQLEAGQPLPATLGETDLHFHLYHQGNELDLLLRDYQGEHVAVGREEPIREFLRDCDAVWLCLDVTVGGATEACLRSEQEVEQLVEDYLAAQPPGTPHRPMALVLTKADLLKHEERFTEALSDPAALNALVEERFAMTRHALNSHCPRQAVLAVSSLGAALPAAPSEGEAVSSEAARPPFQPQPAGLAEPLLWLVRSLQDQDEERLKQLWQLEPNNLPLLQRCVEQFGRRYPGSVPTRVFRGWLRRLRRQRLRRRVLVGAVSLLVLFLSLWGYDAWGQHQAQRFADANAQEPEAVRQRWLSYQFWHPTRHLFLSTSVMAERRRLRLLEEQIQEIRCNEQLAELRRRAADPDADPETVYGLFRQFNNDFPDRDIDSDQQEFGKTLRARRDAERERQAQLAHDELVQKESQTELPAQLARAQKFLREHDNTSPASDVRQRITLYLRRIDERDIEAARTYSARQPFNFHTRRERYQAYLDSHPRGDFVKEANEALAAIDAEWDKHDFRGVRDHFQANPADLKELELRCRSYLSSHPHGRYRDTATALLRWSERVKVEGEYKVKVVSGSFDPKNAHFFSRGLSLSVELEVNGVSYGPSTIARRTSEPEWNYEFPRPIKWKLGDSVRIKVVDNYYWRGTVLDYPSGDSDPLAMKLLSGTVSSGKQSIVFESDFNIPEMPKLE